MNRYAFQDSRPLVKWLKYSMLIWMIVVILMLLTEIIYSTFVYHNMGISGNGVVLRTGAPAIWEVVVITFFPLVKLLVTVLWASFFLMWVYRSHANNWSFRLPRLNYSPTMAVVWFLIPIANWVMGFVVLGELFKASDPESDVPGKTLTWEYSAPPSMIGPWWAGMIVLGPFTLIPFVSSWVFGNGLGIGLIGQRMIEMGLFAIMCTLMFIIWKEARDLSELQEKKYKLIYPNDQKEQFFPGQ